MLFLMEDCEGWDDIRKWRTCQSLHDGSGSPASFPGFGTSVTKSMIRKEEDEVGLTSTGVYLAFRTQTESHPTSAQYNTVHKQNKVGLSRAKRVPSMHSRQSAVCPSLSSFSFPVPLCGPLHALTGTRHRCLSFALDPLTHRSSPNSLSRCRPHWTTPPSPHYLFIICYFLKDKHLVDSANCLWLWGIYDNSKLFLFYLQALPLFLWFWITRHHFPAAAVKKSCGARSSP